MKNNKYLKFEIANFVCKFGNENLLDHFTEKVYPIFHETVKSTRGETYGYQFTNIEIQIVDGHPCVIGRFVQRLRIKARQTLNKNTDDIIPSNDTMLSDPSSIFVLRLQDHRLFLIQEIPRSPKIKQFSRVVDKLLFELWKTDYFLSLEMYKESIKKKRLSKKDKEEFDKNYEALHPRPFFQLTSIADSGKSVSIIEEEFALIKAISVRTYKTNNEDVDADESLLELHREKMEQLNGDTGDIQYKNKKGLNKESVKDLVQVASSTAGNATYKVQGISKDGHSITRTESDSKVYLSAPVPVNYNIIDVAKSVFYEIKKIIKNNTIKITKEVVSEEEKQKAVDIVERLRKTNE